MRLRFILKRYFNRFWCMKTPKLSSKFEIETELKDASQSTNRFSKKKTKRTI